MGVVGAERGAAFLSVFKDKVIPLTPEQVLDYPRHREQLKCWIDSGRLDLVERSLLALQKYLQPKRDYDVIRQDKDNWKHLTAFIKDLPGDLREKAVGFFRGRNYDVPRVGKGV